MERLSCIQVHWQYHTCIPQLPSACASLRACPPRCCTPAYANTVTNMDGKSSESKLPDRENMGWLATSAVPAKKRRMIEGVSGRGVVELQAQLYRTQESAQQRAAGVVDVSDRHVRRKAGVDVMALSNAGVAARAARDEQQRAASGSGPQRLADSAAALERKAALYERLARGEVEDEAERYEVDFFRKGGTWAEEEEQQAAERDALYRQQQRPEGAHSRDPDDWSPGQPSSSGRHQQGHQPPHRAAAAAGGGGGGLGPGSWAEAAGDWGGRGGGAAPDTSAAALGSGGGMMSADMARERERRKWEEAEIARRAAEEEEAERRASHKAAIKQLSAQTEAQRSRAASLKEARAAALADKRAALKAAFLAQQVAKAKAAAGGGAAAAGGTGGGGAAGQPGRG